MKVKVGETWLVNPSYSWGKCLVLVDKTREDDSIIWGYVLDAKDQDHLWSFCMPDQLAKGDSFWSFLKKEFILKVEGVS